MIVKFDDMTVNVQNPSVQSAIKELIFGNINAKATGKADKGKPEESHRQWSEADKNIVVKMYNDNKAPRVIAEVVKRTPAAVSTLVWNLRRTNPELFREKIINVN